MSMSETTMQTDVMVRVRFFAAARAAAGAEEEIVTIASGARFIDLVNLLGERNNDLSRVLERCSYLRDGVAVRDMEASLQSEETIDVLPPFAGG